MLQSHLDAADSGGLLISAFHLEPWVLAGSQLGH